MELSEALRVEIGQLVGVARTATAAILDRRPGWVKLVALLKRMAF